MTNKKTTNEWLEAINKDHNALLDVPKELLTHELCLAAVKKDYAAINYVPEEYFSKDICFAAYQQSPVAIRYVPKDFRELYTKNIENIGEKQQL